MPTFRSVVTKRSVCVAVPVCQHRVVGLWIQVRAIKTPLLDMRQDRPAASLRRHRLCFHWTKNVVSSSAQDHQLLRRHDRRLTMSFLLAGFYGILNLQRRWTPTYGSHATHRSFTPSGLAIHDRGMRQSNLKHCSSLLQLAGNRRIWRCEILTTNDVEQRSDDVHQALRFWVCR
jgi:hypothetical protein